MRIDDLTDDVLRHMTQKDMLDNAAECTDPFDMAVWLLMAFDNDYLAALNRVLECYPMTDDNHAYLLSVASEQVCISRKAEAI